jgi:multiple sugar transport system substrate-binding protein
MKRFLTYLAASLLLITSASMANPFDGMSAEDLFPGAINEQETTTAYDALMASNLPDATDRFAGQTVTVGVLGSGARGGISGPFFFWREAFEKVTGATLEIVELPFGDFLTSTVADFATGQNTYDVITPGAWFYGDYIQGGWIQPLDKFFDDPAYPAWNRDAVAPGIKTLMTWNDEWYGTLYDGDTQLLYYRKDVLADPKWQAAYKAETGEDLPAEPATWQELLKITTFFNGKDWNGDGDEDNGISMHLKGGGFGFFHFMSLSASFAVEPSPGDDKTIVDDAHNLYWFDPKDMSPLINAPGQVAALEYLLELAKTGSRSQVSWDLSEAWNDFLSGNSIATFSWGDVGSLAQDPGASKIQGKLGAARIPCSETWYSREAGEMKTDAANPNCVGNVVGGSWHGVITTASDVPELSYYLIAMLSAPDINFWNVAYGWTGVDVGSTLHLFPPRGTATIEQYVATGYNAADAEEFINAYGDNLFSFDTVQDFLRIPGTPAYWEAMDVRLSEAVTGQSTSQEALDKVAKEWNIITDDLGRDDQLELYRSSIGYTP